MIKIKSILPDDVIALTVFPFIFLNKKKEITEDTLNHERIHIRQQLELLIIGFFILYFFEWLCKGYEDISFEREAYENESDIDYLKKRKMFAWVNYY